MDSDPNVSGTPGEPPAPPAPSAPQGAKPGSTTVTISKEQFDALVKKVDVLSQGAQSEKDRAVRRLEGDFTKLREEVKPLLERAATLIGEGKTVNDALTQVQSEQDDIETKQTLRDIRDAMKNGALPGADAGRIPASGDDMTEVLKKYKLAGNDAQVNVILNRPISKTEKELQLADLAFQRVTLPAPPPAPPEGGTQQSTTLSDDESERMYAELGVLLQNPTINRAKIALLEDKMRKSGLQL